MRVSRASLGICAAYLALCFLWSTTWIGIKVGLHGAPPLIGAGARFLVSPGMTPRLLEAAESWGQPYLPGAATASEAMALADLGYRALKFFPAEPAGGIGYLRALAAPLPEVAFCPTGGIGAANGAAYLALPNVLCVGGSWVVPEAAVAARDWAAITRLAKAAVALGPR
jgi:2-dehydro-3-deoxyphosphogluconate aldolase/(4S)-4-hydroxy-2-oxoglutarate aldolase